MVTLLVIAIMSALIFLGCSLLAHYDDEEQKEHSKGHVRWHVGNKDVNAHHIPLEGISNLKGSEELSPIGKKYHVAVGSLEGEIPISITKYSKDQWYILETKQEITSHPFWIFAKNTEIAYGERLVVTAEYQPEDIRSSQRRIYNNFIEYELKDGRRVFDLPMGDNITFKGKSIYQDDELYNKLQDSKKEIKLFNPVTNEELLVHNIHLLRFMIQLMMPFHQQEVYDKQQVEKERVGNLKYDILMKHESKNRDRIVTNLALPADISQEEREKVIKDVEALGCIIDKKFFEKSTNKILSKQYTKADYFDILKAEGLKGGKDGR